MIMASMNQIGKANNDSVSKFMQDVVGANMGFIFTNDAKKTYDAQDDHRDDPRHDQIRAARRERFHQVSGQIVDDQGNTPGLVSGSDRNGPADRISMSSTSTPSSGSCTSSSASPATGSPWMTTPPMSAPAGRRNFSSPLPGPAVWKRRTHGASRPPTVR